MKFDNILVTLEDQLATVTVNRPKKLNALNRKTIKELGKAMRSLEKNREIRVVILTGSGEKAFVAGADIAEFSDFSVAEGKKLAAKGQELLFSYIQNMGTPVIAAINGYALGGGLELAMACHFRIASDNARMGLPEVSLGVIPGYGGTQRLPRLVGMGRALEMITTGGMIDVGRAMDYGLINHVTAYEELIGYCKKVASKITKNSPVAIAHAIKAVNAGFNHGEDGFAVEIKSFGSCFGTSDFEEGTSAFLEKRPANFTGE